MRTTLRTITAILLFLCIPAALHALPDNLSQGIQVRDTVIILDDSVRVFFPVSRSDFDFSFEENGERIGMVVNRLNAVRENERVNLERVIVSSSSSPEGSIPYNQKLSKARVNAIVDFLQDQHGVDPSIMQVNSRLLDWDRLTYLVNEDENVPSRERVLEICEKQDLNALRALKGTRSWTYMLQNVFPALRTTFAVFHYSVNIQVAFSRPAPTVEETLVSLGLGGLIVELPDIGEPLIPDEEQEFDLPEFRDLLIAPVFVDREQYKGKEEKKVKPVAYHEHYVKSNMLLYPLLIPSIGYEYRPFPRISGSVLAMYSAINWFSNDTKFRVLGVQAEGRYWFKDTMLGPFAGVHANFGWYNVAWGGDYRYQDHKGKKPAYGSGLTIGYKIPFFPKVNSGRMGIEFTLGAGFMPLHYDIYYNVENGRLAGENKLTYWGIDNASISFVYRFAGNPKPKDDF